MRFGLRTKLFLVSVTLIFVVGGLSALYLEGRLRTEMTEDISSRLFEQAEAGKVMIESLSSVNSIESVHPHCEKMGRAFSSRITVIDDKGRVLGDSSFDLSGVRALKNHANRPEIIEAMNLGSGISNRYSQSMDTETLYLATRYSRGGKMGVVRTSLPLSQVDASVSRLRRMILLACFIGIIVAVVMSWLASHLMLRSLMRIVDSSRNLLKGKSVGRLDEKRGDELGVIARSFNEMSAEVERLVESLANDNARLQAVLEMSEAVVVLDGKGVITLVNDSTKKMFGLDDAVVGRPLLEVLRYPALFDLVKRAKSGEAQAAELSLSTLDNPALHLLAQITPQEGASTSVLVIHDITQMKHLERVRQDFVANVSHELRTPVSVIHASAENLSDGALNEPVQAQKFLDAILRNSQRLSRIISDLLDLSRLDAGKVDMEIEILNVEYELQCAVSNVDSEIQRKGSEVDLLVEKGLMVKGDAKALDQVLVNLLENALKYSPAGSNVKLTAQLRDDMVRFEVLDNGPGIAPEYRARVFERFYRVDAGRSKQEGGTGLGLSIVRNLVHSMGGDVGVERGESVGSVFWFVLPAGKPQ